MRPIGRLRPSQRRVGEGRSGGVVGRAADEALADIEAGDVPTVEEFDDAQHLAHDLGADPVAGENENFAVRPAALSHLG